MAIYTRQEPVTESSMSALAYRSTFIEHTIEFHRRQSGQEVNFALQHFDAVHQLSMGVFDIVDGDPVQVQEIELSLNEALLLRAFLNRPEIVEMLNEKGG